MEEMSAFQGLVRNDSYRDEIRLHLLPFVICHLALKAASYLQLMIFEYQVPDMAYAFIQKLPYLNCEVGSSLRLIWSDLTQSVCRFYLFFRAKK